MKGAYTRTIECGGAIGTAYFKLERANRNTCGPFAGRPGQEAGFSRGAVCDLTRTSADQQFVSVGSVGKDLLVFIVSTPCLLPPGVDQQQF
ncbi:hypothetical protein ABZ826_14760 [Streptomyces sp. NPDC047515]|uniref:hypothetical protein n=1 Tax=Streptomyces sp. NPDC047515 TaxID=3155380 RepID=UPI0033CFD40F